MTSEDLHRLPFARPGVLEIAPLLRSLQASTPVTPVRTPAGDVAWLVTGYAETKALLADPRLGRSHPDPDNAARISHAAILGGPSGNADTEAADHAQMRRLLTPAFSARRMHALREHVADLVKTLLDQLAEQTPPVDLHEALAFPLPALAAHPGLLGCPTKTATSSGTGRPARATSPTGLPPLPPSERSSTICTN